MIQLRIRTEYSFGETFAPINRVIERLKQLNCKAAGIVDYSSWGHTFWNDLCGEAGIIPLFGAECIVSDIEDRTTKMWFIAKNSEGLNELYNLLSKSYYQKIKLKRGSSNRLYMNDIIKMSSNIYKFAGDIIDKDFLIDSRAIIDLNPSSRILNYKKSEIAGKFNLETVKTSDNYFAFEEDKKVFELIAKASLKPTPQYIIEDVYAPEYIIENIVKLPKAKMLHEDGDLEQLCRDGIKFRKLKWNEIYEKRLNYELDLIKSKNFESYFIIVSDMVRYAKKHMLVGPSRGSAAGSLVCYLSRITEIDPIPAKLFFERFIDVTRIDLPDIDLDFPDNKRHIIFEYMEKKYKNVAHIGTINRYKPRSALVHVCKKLSVPLNSISAIKVAMIERSSGDARASHCLEDTFRDTKPGRDFIEVYPEVLISSKFEGHASHTGVHAAGLLISNKDISNYSVVDDKGIAHIEKKGAEKLGLLKIDILGLRTLGILEDCGIDIDWYNLKFDDKKVFDVFNSGKLSGIFQFGGDALRSISCKIKFKSLTEIDAVTALARPGPFIGGVAQEYVERINGKKYESIHELVEEYMKETYGLPLYQEQTLAIVREIGKFDWNETSTIRKAMSKILGKEFFDKYWIKFKAGAMSQDIPENKAKQIWEMINAMGSWQMNKAHTYSYAVISYWTAYLKAHYPLEFYAANLRNEKHEDSSIVLLREMKKEGYDFVPFDLKHSEINWCVKNGVLFGGFTVLKGIGEVKARKLIEARNSGELTSKQIELIEKSENTFGNIFPFHNNYQDMYKNPEKYKITDKIVDISDIDIVPLHKHERVFMGELISKSARNENEAIIIKKRGGIVLEGDSLDFLDFRIRDDTGMIGCRINKYDFKRIGKELLEDIPIGAHLLIRAVFVNGIRYAFVKKWRRLDVRKNSVQ